MVSAENTYLTFKVGESLFGISVDHVVAILEYGAPTMKSDILPYMIGLKEYRDEIIPQINAGLKFGLEATQVHEQSYEMVISVGHEAQQFLIAILVDEVSDVLEAEETDKQKIESAYKPGYVAYALKNGDKLVMLLDTDKVFADTDIVKIKEIIEKQKQQ